MRFPYNLEESRVSDYTGPYGLADAVAREPYCVIATCPKDVSPTVAAITNEGPDLYLMVGPGDHTSQRWKLSESLARKLFKELAERLI